MSVMLHIGVGKTGTTSLQYFLQMFQSKLEDQNFYLLKTGAARDSIAHHDLATAFGFGHLKPVDTADVKAKIIAELDAARDKKVIISSENFHSRVDVAKLTDLASCFSEHETKVVMYMRRQDLWIDSAFRQFVQAGNQRPIEKIVEHIIATKAVDYRWQIDMWGSVFGYENIIPRVYEKTQMHGDTIADFSSIIGLVLDSEMQTTRLDVNPSLSPIEAEMCRLINIISKNKGESRVALISLLQGDQTIEHEQYHFMSKEQRENIMLSFAEGNTEVAHRFFQENDGLLFKDDLSDFSYRKIINFH